MGILGMGKSLRWTVLSGRHETCCASIVVFIGFDMFDFSVTAVTDNDYFFEMQSRSIKINQVVKDRPGTGCHDWRSQESAAIDQLLNTHRALLLDGGAPPGLHC